ncbi:MAG: hypothetical protein AAGH15_19880, partial [Myxococcota bacterium]
LGKKGAGVKSSYHDAAAAKACGGGGQATDAQLAEKPDPATDAAGALDFQKLLGEERIDEFFDPRGFARQRARAKRQAAHVRSLTDAEVDAELPTDDRVLVEDHLSV